VLDQPAVAVIIVGARLRRTSRRQSRNLLHRLDDDDRAVLVRPGRDERVRAIAATNTGGLPISRVRRSQPSSRQLSQGVSRRADRGSPGGYGSTPAAGGIDLRYSRAVRIGRADPGQRHHGDPWRGEVVCRGDAPARPSTFLDKIAASIVSLGRQPGRCRAPRIYLAERGLRSGVAVHGGISAATSSRQQPRRGLGPDGDYKVEIEAEALLD